MDTSYFIKSFSATPSAVVPGYTIGGILYFSIPWGLGTVMSSLAIGLENHPSFPTYPRVRTVHDIPTLTLTHLYTQLTALQRMTSSEVSGGLVLPYAAIAIAGKGGATAVLLMTFMAVTSTLSAQVIAVSSILSFDVYRLYFKKNASDRDIIRASHLGVIFFAAFAAGFSTMLHYVGIDLGWTLYMLGVVTCPGVFPMAFTVLWRHQSKAAAILAPVLGICTGIAVWLGTAYRFYGSVSVSATGELLPCVYGTVASAFSPILYSIVITLVKPQNYDWANFRAERLALEKLESDLTTVHHDQTEDNTDAGRVPPPEETPVVAHPDPSSSSPEDGASVGGQTAAKELKRWGRIAAFWSAATFLGHWVIWPLPMYGSKYVFDKKFYYAWVVVAVIWLWLTMLVATFYPILDGGIQQITQVWRGWKAAPPRQSKQKNALEGSGANSLEGASPSESETVDAKAEK